MAIKDAFDNLLDIARDTVANVMVATNEATHRTAAEAEQTKRDVAGDQMTVGQNGGSMLDQAKNYVRADIDAAKRDVRNNT
jgi:hypothetical protein